MTLNRGPMQLPSTEACAFDPLSSGHYPYRRSGTSGQRVLYVTIVQLVLYVSALMLAWYSTTFISTCEFFFIFTDVSFLLLTLSNYRYL